jgi:hypothetical protein
VPARLAYSSGGKIISNTGGGGKFRRSTNRSGTSGGQAGPTLCSHGQVGGADDRVGGQSAADICWHNPEPPLLLIKSGNGAEFLQPRHLRACANLHLGFELIALLDCSNTDRKEFRIFHMARVYL